MRADGREPTRAGYVISVAAELAGVHPQTRRIYERKGLVDPARTIGGSRRYSDADIDQLRRIQELTNEGLNLYGVQRVLALEAEVGDLHLIYCGAALPASQVDTSIHRVTAPGRALPSLRPAREAVILRRLAAAEITTREACGNAVRNVTACPYSGVCRDEVFDVTPYSRALAKFLLGHPGCQDFGRKFKPSFSGCADHGCGLARMHDLGLVAVSRTEAGQEKREPGDQPTSRRYGRGCDHAGKILRD